ncbi:MAG: MarR family transcriptional regulator [Oscillochloris sp.]|nr:MarR family transcriptional regulator [Oscillochloris sp.]
MKPIAAIDTATLASLVTSFHSVLNIHSFDAVLTILRETELSLPRFVALSYLYRSGSASISQISEHLNLALGTTSHVVDQLVQSGYVERRESEHDRRHKEVSLTSRGRDVIERLRRHRIDQATEQLAGLSPDITTRLAATLEETIRMLHTK